MGPGMGKMIVKAVEMAELRGGLRGRQMDCVRATQKVQGMDALMGRLKEARMEVGMEPVKELKKAYRMALKTAFWMVNLTAWPMEAKRGQRMEPEMVLLMAE